MCWSGVGVGVGTTASTDWCVQLERRPGSVHPASKGACAIKPRALPQSPVLNLPSCLALGSCPPVCPQHGQAGVLMSFSPGKPYNTGRGWLASPPLDFCHVLRMRLLCPKAGGSSTPYSHFSSSPFFASFLSFLPFLLSVLFSSPSSPSCDLHPHITPAHYLCLQLLFVTLLSPWNHTKTPPPAQCFSNPLRSSELSLPSSPSFIVTTSDYGRQLLNT